MLGFVGVRATAAPMLRRRANLTLEEEVEALGLQVVPLDRVRAYQERIKQNWEAMSGPGVNYRGKWEVVKLKDIHTLDPPPPPDVVAAIEDARTIPNSTVYAEKFMGDPFVFVRRLGAHKREIVCFKYFNAPGFEG